MYIVEARRRGFPLWEPYGAADDLAQMDALFAMARNAGIYDGVRQAPEGSVLTQPFVILERDRRCAFCGGRLKAGWQVIRIQDGRCYHLNQRCTLAGVQEWRKLNSMSWRADGASPRPGFTL